MRENIEGQNLEQIITDLMTTQLGIDLEDLYLNGDEATESTDPDYDFLKINDGWIKQIRSSFVTPPLVKRIPPAIRNANTPLIAVV